jgi:CBS domain-containing protein
MAEVRDLLASKGRLVFCTEPRATVLEATQQMNSHRVGALVVMDGEFVAGIFTERDVLTRVVVQQRDPSKTPVAEVMTPDVAYARLDTDLEEIGQSMKSRRIRHIPICDENGRLQGLVSMGDLNAWRTSGQQEEIHYLSEYIHGRV